MRFATVALALAMAFAGIAAHCQDATTDTKNPAIADSAEEVKPLQADGATKLPALILKTVDGEPFDLNKSVAQKPTVLVFYRGNWCPYCASHLAAVQKVSKEIVEAGFQILAISPDKPENLKKSIKKAELTYTLLSDPALKAAQAFGLAYRVSDSDREKLEKFGIDLSQHSGEKHNLLPVPALYLIAPDGTLLYTYFNADYTKRLAPADLLKALATHSGIATN